MERDWEIHPDLAYCLGSDDMLLVSVNDNGCGIKQQDQSKLFNLYGFVEETKEINTQGIGLGLHISRRIVREMGGDIICQSTWGQGSKFTFIVRLG